MPSARQGVLLSFSVCVALAMVLFFPASASAQTVLETPQQANDRIRALSSNARALPHDYIIGTGDVLAIQVFDVQELSREVRVSQMGSIGIPLVPVRLHVAGLTEMQAQQKIAEVLEANGLVSHPEVTVDVKERRSKPITVVGAVSHPMVYQADHPVSVLEVLAEAGGISNDAGDTVIVTRPPAPDPEEPPAIGPESANVASNTTTPPNVDTAAAQNSAPASSAMTPQAGSSSAASTSEPPLLNNVITLNLNDLMENGVAANNILLQAGDIVTVPHAGIVYVLGAVSKPGGFVLANDRSQMTTLKVLSLAGGLNNTAKSEHAVIIRKDSQGKQHEVLVDLKKVQKRETEDVQLLPSDILFVPTSGAKQALIKAAEFGIALGSGVALYRLAYR